MTPRMKPGEMLLLRALLTCTDHYLEFGSGGSTCLAASLAQKSVTSVDSSREWLDSVGEFCAQHSEFIQPRLIYVDIGPIGKWGVPTDKKTKPQWSDYHSKVWEVEGCNKADLFMVDGRFRVACFLQTLLHCQPDALIAFHDFSSRPKYHLVREFAREVARDNDLSVFQRHRDWNEEGVRAALLAHASNPG